MVERADGSRGWDGALEPDPLTGPTVRAIFDAFASGLGARAIALRLNAAGKRAASGGPWTSNAVDRILSNPAFAGRMVRYRRRRSWHYFDRDATDGYADLGERFPALIDSTLFDQIQALRAERVVAGGRTRVRTYPLSSVLRCARCGHRMTGVRSAKARYYRCRGRRVLGICDAPAIRADRAESAFAEWLGSYRLPDDWRDAIAGINVRTVRAGERDRHAVLRARLARLGELYAWGDLTRDAYLAQTAELKAEIGVIKMPVMPTLERVAEALGDLGAAWRKAPPETQAAIPPLMLKAAEVEDGEVATWVVDAGLRPLLEMCVPARGYVSIGG
jgi:site-specific DNA recombinase